MFYSPKHEWAYEPLFQDDIADVPRAVFNVPAPEYGIVIKLKDGTQYVIEDDFN